jgi:hypothetical protein
MSTRLDILIEASRELAAQTRRARAESRRLVEHSRTLFQGNDGRLASWAAVRDLAGETIGPLRNGTESSRPSDLELAETHVEQAEKRIARQKQLICEMERDKHSAAAHRARTVLVTFQSNLTVLRAHMAEIRRQADRRL